VRVRELKRALWLPRPLAEIFSFFADAANLELLTPPWLNFHILTRGRLELRAGTLIDYQLRVHGLPMRWQSEITAWEPQRRFVDEQRRGPYRLWQHEHTFEPDAGGTLCGDTVRYAVLFDFPVHGLLVRPDIERIFDFRAQKMRELFSATGSEALT